MSSFTLPLIRKASNALTIGTRRVHVTFWQRAMSSAGSIEVRQGPCQLLYASACLWGYMVSFEATYSRLDRPHRVFVHRYLDWARYNSGTPAKRGHWQDRVRVRLVRWLLASPAAQKEIARTMASGGAMCHVISEAVEHHMQGVDVENISGLDRMLTDSIETAMGEFERNLEVEADEVKGLDEVLEKMLQDPDVVDALVSAVGERLMGGR